MLTLLAAAALAGAGGSAAQEPDTNVRLVVSELTGVLGPGTLDPPDDDTLDPYEDDPEPPTTLELRVLVENRGAAPLDALRLVVEVHPAAPSRAALQDALAGEPRTDPILVDDPTLRDGALGAGEIVGAARSFEQDRIGWSEDGGVHPVRIAVVRGTEVLADAMTAIVWLAEPPASPIATALVWPLDETPWRDTGAAYPSGIDRSIHPGGRIDQLVRALEHAGAPPVVLAPAPHLLEDLRDRADGFVTIDHVDQRRQELRRVPPEAPDARRANELLRRIRSLATDLPHPPVTGVYADADLSALHATRDRPTRELASDAAASGRLRLQSELGRAPDGAVHLLSQGVAPPVLDLLAGGQLLVPAGALAVPPPNGPTPSEPLRALRSPAGRSVTALLADPELSTAISDPAAVGGPLLATQRVLAETAMLHLAAPSRPGRTLLLLPEPDWDPGIDAASRLLDGLSAAPWLELADAGSVFASGRRSSQALELATPAAGEFGPEQTTEFATAVAELRAATAMLPDGSTTIAGRTPGQLEDSLLLASSRWLRGDARSDALVADVRDTLHTFFGEVTLSEASVTLTSETGQIPVTVQRTEGGPIAVQVEVASQGRLIWPEGRRSEVILLEEGGSMTLAFPTEALATGSLWVEVTVTDPAGLIELQSTTLSVRSTAISGPALAGISALVIVLLLIGALRRRPTPELTVVATTDGRRTPADPRYSR